MEFANLVMFTKKLIVYVLMINDVRSVMSACSVNKCNVPSRWLQMAENVCYGHTDSAFGNITFTRQCDLVGMRLRHVSGGFKNGASTMTWGTNYFWTIITDTSDAVVYPKKLIDDRGLYQLDGFSMNDELIFFNNHPPIQVRQNEKMRLRHGLALKKYLYRYAFPGSHCVHIDVSCLE